MPAFPSGRKVRLRPRSDTLYVSQSRSVLATDRDGFLRDGNALGFLCFETRFLSRYEMFINGVAPHANVLSNIQQHSWLGYYTCHLPEIHDRAPKDEGSGQMTEESERTLELRLSRYVGDGVHEDIDFTNFTGEKIRFEFKIEAHADFADQKETSGDRRQNGNCEMHWSRLDAGEHARAEWRYHAEHDYTHQGFSGHAELNLGFTIDFHHLSTQPEVRDGAVVFTVELAPREKWHACVDMVPEIEGRRLPARYDCHSFGRIKSEYDEKRQEFLSESASFEDPDSPALASHAIEALTQAKSDLAGMRLFDLDTDRRAWTVAAGLPIYTAFYGRDTLTAGWQAGLLGPELIKGALPVLAEHQGDQVINWFDEEPGRMLHEMHPGPLSALFYGNHGNNYGAVTTTHLYPFMVASLWHWTGDRALVERYIEPALKALAWMSKYSDADGDGLYEYHTKSVNGVKNQGWKDSPDSIVYPDGSRAEPPIAMCEEQAFAYLSKFFFSETLWSLGRKSEARKVFRESKELRARFNEAFWMEDEGFIAMALDSKKRQIKSIGSDPGHCLAAGLIDKSLVQRVADRLMRKDLFSGWGIRTLSSDHPSFNPYSYHRGSVWPVENGTFTVGFARYGLWGHLERLARATFEAASIFELHRLPEVISGHQRNQEHPIPALYPKSNSPQAWSSSAVINVLQGILGIYPYAPLKTLIVNPELPAWLPRIQVNGVRVGKARVSILFYRKPNGNSDYSIVDQDGDLRVLKQATPWSLTTGIPERLSDLVGSLWH